MSNIYSAPSADMSADLNNDETYTPEMFSLKGRIGRCRLLAYSMGMMLIFLAVFGLLMALMGRDPAGALFPILTIILYIPLVGASFVFTIRRLNDLDQSGWLSLLNLVPFVNALFGLYLMIAPGTQGRNSYGPPPGPNTGLIIAGALIVPVMMILGIVLAIAIPGYMGYSQRATQSSGRI